jgi:signal transduction histidine kinase
MLQLVFTQSSQKEPFFVNADNVRICEVISNPLGNAIKFTTKETAGSITNKAEGKDSEASVSIKDCGSGISQSYFLILLQIHLEGQE